LPKEICPLLPTVFIIAIAPPEIDITIL